MTPRFYSLPTSVRCLVMVAATLGAVHGAPAPVSPADPDLPVYRHGGFSSMINMGKTLFRSLPPKFRDQLHFLPVNVELDPQPFIRAEEVHYPDMPKPLKRVVVSAGFADFVNNVAHAKALERLHNGIFLTYVVSLSKESGEEALTEVAHLNNRAYWVDDVMNEQESNFNQIAGILIAIELSHHYLGHFEKYRSQLKDADGKPVPINRLLTPSEWETAVRAGVFNALDCGFGVEGMVALYEALARMPQRPAWTLCFAPPTFKYSKLRRDLKRYEANYFAGQKK